MSPSLECKHFEAGMFWSLQYGQDLAQLLAQGGFSVNCHMNEQLDEGPAQTGCLVG